MMDMKHIERVLETLFFYKYFHTRITRKKMASLSEKEYATLRDLYQQVYSSQEVEIAEELQIDEELIDEVFDELVEEYIEEGYSEEDALEILDEAVDAYIDEVLCEVSDSYYDSAVRASKKAAKGLDKAARQKRRAGQVRYAKRKAGEALKAAGDKVRGAAAGVQIAGSIAKDEARRAGRKAAHAATSAPGKAKKGIKGFIKRQAQKVVDRMSEEAIQEADSLAAMRARREKRLAAQRKREGTTMAGNDTGHNYSLTPAQQKARRDAEYKSGTRKEEVAVSYTHLTLPTNREV